MTLEWNLDPVLFTLGGFAVRGYSIALLGSILLGFLLFRWQVLRGGGFDEDAGDFLVWGSLLGMVGGRLGHVVFYDLDRVLEDPAWVFAIWQGGMASHGAILGVIVAMWLHCRRRGVALLEGTDRLCFSAALMAALMRVGNLLNSEIVGRVTDGSWGVRFPKTCVVRSSGARECWGYDDALRHPSQLYEVVLGLLVLAALLIADRTWGKESRPRGAITGLFLTAYPAGRIFVELWKEPLTLPDVNSTVSTGQLLSLPYLAAGVVLLAWAFRRRQAARWDHPEDIAKVFS